MNRAVFLDRDGVINRVVLREGRPYPPCSVQELEFIPGVAEAIVRLKSAGFRIIVVTNQPDVASGAQRQEMVEAIHKKILEKFSIDDIQVCYHIDQNHCLCRKPKPGMLLASARQWVLDLSQSVMIGDRWRDIEAGERAGCKTIWMDFKYQERQPEKHDYVTDSLLGVLNFILENK